LLFVQDTIRDIERLLNLKLFGGDGIVIDATTSWDGASSGNDRRHQSRNSFAYDDGVDGFYDELSDDNYDSTRYTHTDMGTDMGMEMGFQDQLEEEISLGDDCFYDSDSDKECFVPMGNNYGTEPQQLSTTGSDTRMVNVAV
jgi:hypothetical protein